MAGTSPDGQVSGREVRSLSGFEAVAIVLSLIWLGVVGYVVLGGYSDFDALRTPLILLSIIMPLAVIWLAAAVLRIRRDTSEDLTELRRIVDHLRQNQIAQVQAGAQAGAPAVSPPAPARSATPERRVEAPAAPGQTGHDQIPEAQPVEQGQLNLEPYAPAGDTELSHQDFVSAMNFPQSAEDTSGFSALRRARRNHIVAPLVQAAEDLLTLLSHEGIYMDDLAPDKARPEIWRRFAHGVRGREVSDLGGVRDPEILRRTAARLKEDPIFRDTVMHFLRRFDQVFSAFESEATDVEISLFAETRTARAFMLVGRVAGTFD